MKSFARSKQNKRKPNLRTRELSLLGVPVKKVVRTNELISTNAGSPFLKFASTSDNYWNISSLSTTADFGLYVNNYQLFKMEWLTVKITRVCSETVLSTIFPDGVTNLYIPFMPILFDSPQNSSATEIESALTVYPFNNRSVSKTFPMVNATMTRVALGISYSVNITNYTQINQLVAATGQIVAVGLYPGNATSSTAIYQAEISAGFIFAAPL
jgi:hypothetical protein